MTFVYYPNSFTCNECYVINEIIEKYDFPTYDFEFDAAHSEEWRYHHYDDVNLTRTPDEIVRYHNALEDIWDDLNHAVEYKNIQARLAILHAAEENSD